jgi:prephenate dehydrogenase
LTFWPFTGTFLTIIKTDGEFYKVFNIKDLKKITVVGMGLLGASITMSVMRAFPRVLVVGFSHRKSTRSKAARFNVANHIAETLQDAVTDADIVILATPILTFEACFCQIAPFLKSGCIVTDVGSTKASVHQWAGKKLPKTVCFVGSHPIAGSEKRGVEYARDDLLTSARCILTQTPKTNRQAVGLLKSFWTAMGCKVETMNPVKHDRIYGLISHLPHITAAALVNASDFEDMKYAGKGFIDTSRLASGPADVWTDVLLTNDRNIVLGLDRLIQHLNKLKTAMHTKNARKISKLLENAREKRHALIEYKLKHKEIY